MADVDRRMRQAVADSVFPGAVIRVSREHRVLFCRAYGHANRVTRRAMTTATLFDLASLTKPLATTLAVMLLHQRGRIDVAARLASVLPAFAGSDKAGVTVAQLLSHTSGLPDYRPYHAQLATRPFLERAVGAAGTAPPGAPRAPAGGTGALQRSGLHDPGLGRRGG